MQFTYNINKISEALRKCKRYTVFIPADPNIPDDEDREISTIEVKEFIDHLTDNL